MHQSNHLRQTFEVAQKSAGIGRLSLDLREGGEFGSVRYSEAYLRIHGLSPEVKNWSRADWSRHLHPDDRKRVEQEFDEEINNPDVTAVCTVYRIIRPSDGETRWVEVDHEVERNGEGKALHIVGEHRDVTERKAAEEALRQSEQRLRNILDTMPQKVCVIRPDGSHDYLNRHWYEYTGLPEGSGGGDGPFEALHPEDFERTRAIYGHSLETGEACEVEARLRHHSGEFRWHLFRALPVRDSTGRIERWCGTGTDIHDRKLAEEQAHLTDRRTQLALASSQAVCTTEWDVLTGQVFVDAQAASFFSRDPAVAAGGAPMRDFVAKIHPDDRPRVEAHMASSLRFGGAYELEYRVISPDGGVRWISDRGCVEHDASACPIRTRGVLIDVTQLKKLQEANGLLSRELMHRIKNVFSVISALSSLSAKESSNEVKRYAGKFRHRLHALSSALIYMEPRRSKHSCEPDHTVMGLVRVLLAPFVGEDAARLIFRGEDAPLSHDNANSLALLVHELATNASKHGSLSRRSGTIEITGKIEHGVYLLTWCERGGPRLEGPPQRLGFGMSMTAKFVSVQLGGAIDYAWDADGLTMSLFVPLLPLAGETPPNDPPRPNSDRPASSAAVPAENHRSGQPGLPVPARVSAMAALIDAFDWSKTPLGPATAWHHNLRSAAEMILGKEHPMSVCWGPELVHLYNDAALEVSGPQWLGCPVSEAWAEGWKGIESQFAFVLSQNSPTWSEQRLIPVRRNGRLVSAWWTYALTPISVANSVGGVLMAFNEVPRPVEIPTALPSCLQRMLTEMIKR